MLRQYKLRNYNFKLIFLVLAISMIGIIAVGSAQESLQSRQIGGFAAGVAIMIALSLFDYSIILKLYWLIYAANVVLLALVIFIGDEGGGAQRWLDIGGFRFQPSEIAKIFMILFFAEFLRKNRERLNTVKYIVLSVVLFGILAFLIVSQPDLSTTIVFCLIFASIMFVAGISWKLIAGVLAVAIPAAVILIFLILQPDQKIFSGDTTYQGNRIIAFFNKEEYANTLGYQQEYSVMAIGSGQLTGKGYKTNQISSVKNANFISEQETDFIYAVIGEEFGFIGSSAVVILLLLISLECFAVARKAKDTAGAVIATGIGALIGFQSFINIGVVTYLLSNTGLPLPFVSYGLTSLISSFIGIGLVLNVGLQCKQK